MVPLGAIGPDVRNCWLKIGLLARLRFCFCGLYRLDRRHGCFFFDVPFTTNLLRPTAAAVPFGLASHYRAAGDLDCFCFFAAGFAFTSSHGRFATCGFDQHVGVVVVAALQRPSE